MEKNILKKALISEKSFQKTLENKVSFIVDKKASKFDIAGAVADLFNVTVMDINTANFKGKIKKSRKGSGARSDFKKAVLTLKKGDKIDLFEIEKDDQKKEDSKSKDKKESATTESKDTTVKIREKKK
ncbi:MAG: 50S ribosomal protein L23 [Candidatus Berkelbacteria bacterium]|nr:50S ribosomal protein L23 [Candidatus Berkelbacteria bacterium]